MTTIAAGATIDHESLWGAIRSLSCELASALERDALIDECLDCVVELLGADRGMILLGGESSAPVVIHARTRSRALTELEQQEVSRGLIREVLDTGRSVTWTRRNAQACSLIEMGVWYALAAPIRVPASDASRSAVGVLYVDFRDYTKQAGPLHEEFVDTVGVMLAGVVHHQRQLDSARDSLHRAQVETGRGMTPGPSLDELLAPPSMSGVRRELQSALHGDSPILILGESGTGKTLLAAAIAAASGRTPVVRATLGASDDLNTITSELFGHERGAFTGAVGRRKGVVEYAHGGTLILDEILNLPALAQQLLLDFTQFGTYRPLGHASGQARHADVRLIVATNGDLRKAIDDGTFREDLFYRLAGVRIRVPSLRDRRQDIPAMAETILRRVDPTRPWRLGMPLRKFLASPALTWRGNVRQLEHAIDRARQRARVDGDNSDTLEVRHLGLEDVGVSSLPGTESPTPVGPSEALVAEWRDLGRRKRELDGEEAALIRRVVAENDGVVSHAARALDLPRTTLASRMRALDLK